MSISKLAAVGLVGAVLAIATAGCGSSKNTTTTTTAAAATATTSSQSPSTTSVETVKIQTGKPLSKKVWIVRGDAICSRAAAKLGSTTAKTEQDLVRLLPQAAAYERVEATELSKLVPPASKSADWQQIVDEIMQFSGGSLKIAEYARANATNEATPILHQMNVAARSIAASAKHDGFKKCSIEL